MLWRTLGCCRLVYNKALHQRSEAWTTGKKSIGYIQQSAALTAWKKADDLLFLNEVSCVPLQQALRHLQVAYSNFFTKRAKYPSFKKRHSGGSATVDPKDRASAERRPRRGVAAKARAA